MEEMHNNTNTLPPGFRFHPTDEELITYYLGNKVNNFEFKAKAVADVDLNKCEPWDLPAKATMGEKEWYFFSQRDRKYPTGLRTNRATEAGYWKTTGKDKEIFHNGGNVVVGMKKTLVFYRGRAPKGEKTNWVMHEYRLIENKLHFKPNKDEWVVCRVFQKTSSPKRPQQTPSSPPSQDSPSETNAMINKLGDIELPNYATMNMSLHPSSNYAGLIPTDLHTNTINWPATQLQANSNMPASLASWPFLGTNFTMNSLLLTALQQLRGHNPARGLSSPSANPAEMINGYGSFMPQTQFGNDPFGSGFNLGSTSSAAPQMPQQEQTYDVEDNMW